MLNLGSQRVASMLPNALVTTHSPGIQPTVYLTFDDGPHPEVTEGLCETLEKYSAFSSFFCIGANLESYPGVAKRIIDGGHSIHNHSHTHRDFRRLSSDEQLEELASCQQAIERLNPGAAKVFRAPRGQLPLKALLLLKRHRWATVHWSYDSLDYQKPQAEALITRLRKNPPRNGDIMLFHDDSELCINVLDTLIPEWLEQGYRFATIDELVG